METPLTPLEFARRARKLYPERVAYLSPNSHAQLESFYAVPQIGAVLVPLNYRLTADDFVYLINHSGSCVICADRDYLETIDSIREQLPKVEHFIALSCNAGSPQANSDWLNYEAMVNASPAEF